MYKLLAKAGNYTFTNISRHTWYSTWRPIDGNRSIPIYNKGVQFLTRIRLGYLYIQRCQTRQSTYDQPGDMSALQLKRRHRQKAKVDNELVYKSPGVYNITAFPTAEEINLEDLTDALKKELFLKAEHFQETLDFVRATSKEQDGCEPQEMFVFREGVAVMWNVSSALAPAYLAVINKHSQHRYAEGVIKDESESIPYKYNYHHEQGTRFRPSTQELLVTPDKTKWDKFVVSHVMAGDVKLRVWERQQEKYISEIEFVCEDLKYGQKIQISESRALTRHGALFTLRHVINLSSALLRAPDIPGRDLRMTNLYLDLRHHFAMDKRVRRLYDKMDHCFEIIALITAHLRDKHKLRLEWLVILMVVLQLAFQGVYLLDRFYITDK